MSDQPESPSPLDPLMQEATALHRNGELAAAVASYQQAIAIAPDHPEILHLLGLALFQSGDQQPGLDQIRRAITIQPQPLYYFNLGRLLAEQDDHQGAEEAYRAAVERHPDYAEALENLARTLWRRKEVMAAIPLMERVVKLRPEWGESWHFLGQLYRRGHNTTGARSAWFNAFQRLGRPGILLLTVITMPSVYSNRKHIEDARNDLLGVLPKLKGVTITHPYQELLNTPFAIGYHHQPSRPIMSALARTISATAPALGHRPADGERTDQITTPGRHRIGVISALLREHSVTRFYASIILDLPAEQWELTLIMPDYADQDEVTGQFLQRADRVILLENSLERSQQQLAECGLDLLLWLEVGQDLLTWQLAFGRYAPIQVLLPGHPLTSGIDTIDYYISHAGCEPEGAAEHYSERLRLLPDDSTYVHFRPSFSAIEPIDRAHFGLPDERHIYLCPQMLMKIHPDMDGWFNEILKQDPKALIVLINSNAQHKKELAQRMESTISSGTERVVFLPFQRGERYLQLALAADAVLDSWPFSGGVSSLDLFALGVPLVTLPGPEMRGRQTLHLYRRMGIDELIASTPEEYIGIALRLVDQPQWAAAMRGRILEAVDRIIDDHRVVDATHRELLAIIEEAGRLQERPRPR